MMRLTLSHTNFRQIRTISHTFTKSCPKHPLSLRFLFDAHGRFSTCGRSTANENVFRGNPGIYVSFQAGRTSSQSLPIALGMIFDQGCLDAPGGVLWTSRRHPREVPPLRIPRA
eukprot:635887-Amorphochlora_amoeboformis.AAC.1